MILPISNFSENVRKLLFDIENMYSWGDGSAVTAFGQDQVQSQNLHGGSQTSEILILGNLMPFSRSLGTAQTQCTETHTDKPSYT